MISYMLIFSPIKKQGSNLFALASYGHFGTMAATAPKYSPVFFEISDNLTSGKLKRSARTEERQIFPLRGCTGRIVSVHMATLGWLEGVTVAITRYQLQLTSVITPMLFLYFQNIVVVSKC